MADRYSYLPLLGVELALFGSIPTACRSPRARIGGIGAAVAILTALGARTWDQQKVWRDSVALFTHAVAVDETNGVAHEFLASALLADERLDEAAVHAERACALAPTRATALSTLAGIRERQGRMPEAIVLYRAALALRGDNVLVQMQLGLLELTQGRVNEARRLMTDALRAAPTLRGRTMEIGYSALAQGDANAALFIFSVVLAVSPDDAEAHVAAGRVLLRAGREADAAAAWRRALELDPDQPGLREELRRLTPER